MRKSKLFRRAKEDCISWFPLSILIHIKPNDSIERAIWNHWKTKAKQGLFEEEKALWTIANCNFYFLESNQNLVNYFVKLELNLKKYIWKYREISKSIRLIF